MTDSEKLAICRNALERVGPLLDDTANILKCQKIIAEALTKTITPILPDMNRIFPHIGITDHRPKP